MAKPMVILLVLMLIGVAVYLKCNCNQPHPPHLDPEEWWGPKELRARQDKTVRPFQVKFGEEIIKDLKDRLKHHRQFAPPLEDSGFRYGFNSAQLDTWVNYWAEKYPFVERERFLNKFPQFKTNIQGLDIHFIRVKPQVQSGVEVVPLLLMHGWPGSVREFYEAIPLLTTKTSGHNFVFEVIVPSLPGYGFSDAAVRPGLGAAQVAVVMRNLMNRLGFKKYYVQGGDWGAVIASAMSTLYPDEVLGHHTNMAYITSSCNMVKAILGSVYPSLVVEPHLVDRMYPLSHYFAYLLEEFGYMHLQATKPDTVGVALTDSPSGLLAYIIEKFSTWTIRENRNLPDGGLVSKQKFTKDQLIDNLMIYWSTNSITTSMRLYSESFNKEHHDLKLDCIPTNVPTWALQAKEELFYQPPGFLKSKYPNLLNTTVLDFGGHFFAFEEPKVFAEDVFKAVDAFKSWHKQRVKTEL